METTLAELLESHKQAGEFRFLAESEWLDMAVPALDHSDGCADCREGGGPVFVEIPVKTTEELWEILAVPTQFVLVCIAKLAARSEGAAAGNCVEGGAPIGDI
jgi:hypothetical protein